MESSNLKYYPRLDHLRFLAALMVLFWHLTVFVKTPFINTPSFWPFSFAQEGHTGVALFMTLSGFIFWFLCKEKQIDYKKFIFNRILRIAPLFLFWILIYFYVTDIDPTKLFVSIFGLLNKNVIPGNAWTIVVEFQFYLIFPFLLFFSRRFGIRYLLYLMVLSLFIRFSVWIMNDTVQYLAYSTIFGRIDQFCFGMFFCEISFRYKSIFSSKILFCLVLIAWVAIFHYFDLSGGFFDKSNVFPHTLSTSFKWIFWPFLEGFFYGTIIACYLNVIFILPKLLDISLAWLGSLSYSLYLNQNFSIQVVSKVYKTLGIDIQSVNEILLFGVLVFLLLLLFSTLTYYLIEKPFLLLRKNYFIQKS
jgi:peptidoglycan/LPS O-acetylase OafA/YrhL